MMRSVRIRELLVSCTVLAFGAGVASPASAQQGVIKIATQSPLSGGQAALGEGIKLGAQLAVEQLKGPVEKLGFQSRGHRPELSERQPGLRS